MEHASQFERAYALAGKTYGLVLSGLTRGEPLAPVGFLEVTGDAAVRSVTAPTPAEVTRELLEKPHGADHAASFFLSELDGAPTLFLAVVVFLGPPHERSYVLDRLYGEVRPFSRAVSGAAGEFRLMPFRFLDEETLTPETVERKREWLMRGLVEAGGAGIYLRARDGSDAA